MKTLCLQQILPPSVKQQVEFYPAIAAAKVLGNKNILKLVLINIVWNDCEINAQGETFKSQIDSNANLN
jgi:hypothetical protein